MRNQDEIDQQFQRVCPALPEFERTVVDWLANALALPTSFTYGGGKGGGFVLVIFYDSSGQTVLHLAIHNNDRAVIF